MTAEELGRLRAEAQKRKTGPRVTLTATSTKAERAAFLQKVRSEDEVLAERVEQRMTQGWTEREERFAQDLQRYWNEATWLCNASGFLGHFPDGRCLREQRQIDLTIWGILTTALINRMNGVKPKGKGESDEEQAPEGFKPREE